MKHFLPLILSFAFTVTAQASIILCEGFVPDGSSGDWSYNPILFKVNINTEDPLASTVDYKNKFDIESFPINVKASYLFRINENQNALYFKLRTGGSNMGCSWTGTNISIAVPSKIVDSKILGIWSDNEGDACDFAPKEIPYWPETHIGYDSLSSISCK